VKGISESDGKANTNRKEIMLVSPLGMVYLDCKENDIETKYDEEDGNTK